MTDLAALERDARAQGSNSQAMVELARIYLQLQQTNRAVELLDGVINSPSAEPAAVIRAAMLYSDMLNWPKREASLEKLVKISPESPEAWYDLAAMKANLRKDREALPALSNALSLNARRLKENPDALNLLAHLSNDQSFLSLRQSPEYQRLITSN